MLWKKFTPLNNSIDLYSKSYNSINENTSYNNSNTKNDVTLITQTSVDRIFFFKYLTQRWTGPINVVVAIEGNETSMLNLYESSLNSYSLIDYDFFEINETYYPINLLRNIAIRNIKTTHFFVCDMDFWPSSGIYQHVISLPDYILNDDWLAIIVPGFQYYNQIPNCRPFQDCIENIIPLIPTTKRELKQCMIENKCTTFQIGSYFHKYHYSTWFDENKSRQITMLNNLLRELSEPYLIIRKSSHLPLFDERFINYGYNKQQWVENLRYIGYKFAQLVQCFGIDIPHPIIKHKKQWILASKENHTRLNYDVFKTFLSELRKSPERSVLTSEKKLVENDPFQDLK